jgi:hypothetical protein
MTITANAGPLVTFGQNPQSDYNPDRGPSLFDQGSGLLDPRTPYTYQVGGASPLYGFLGSTHIPVIQAIPSALAADNIAASQTPTAGTPLTLVAASGAGITVGVSITRADTGATVTGLLAIDGAASGLAFGSGGTGSGGPVHIWDPTTLIARAVRVHSGGDDTGATFTVNGFDIYGYPMTETITGGNNADANGKKAFKYILSITPAGTLSGSAVTAGTTDIIGLPLRADYVNQTELSVNGAWVTASTGFTAAVTTTPSATTGDVRGTYALQTASTGGTNRLGFYITPLVANLSTATGLFGPTQYANF